MNNKFRRVAAFALAMTVIAGSSNVFNVGVGGLPNLTSIVANAQDDYKVHNLINDYPRVNYSELRDGDIIIVADDINGVAGILNDTVNPVYINQYSLDNGMAVSLEGGYKYKVTSRESGGFDVTKIEFTYIDASFNDGTEETILSEQSITANADVVILNKDNKVTNWKNGQTYVVMDSIGISDRITVNGTVKLILCDNATLTAEKGITVSEGQTLNIYAQSTGEYAGRLIANGSYLENETDLETEYFAPIGETITESDTGRVHEYAGTINIYGGNVNANVMAGAGTVEYVPAIGGMNGTVNIYNGDVMARTNDSYEPDPFVYNDGIYGSNINIYGGFVEAVGIYGINGTTATKIYGGTVIAIGLEDTGYPGINGDLTVGNDVTVYGSNEPFSVTNPGTEIVNGGVGYARYPYMKTIGKQPVMEIDAPTITKQPSDIEVKIGSDSGNTLTVAASADTGCTFSYQWYSSTDNSVGTNEDNIPINGATNSTYTVPTDTVGKKYYYCRVTAKKDNQSKTTVSNIAEVGVYYEASFDKGADDANGTIAAIKSYDGNVTLPIAGFTRNGYDLAGWKVGNSDRIDANTEANISDNAIFTAQWYKPVLGINNSNIDDNNTIPVVVGYAETETLSANVINDASYVYTYQWYEDDAVIQGATSPNYTIPTGKEVGEHKYYCKVTAKHKESNNTITANSLTITFKVNSIPVQADEINADLVFEGNENPKAINVKYNDIDLDYHEEYEENSVKIVLDGNYSGSKTINYEHTLAKEPTHNTNGNVEYWTYNDVNYIKENNKFKKSDDLTIPSTSINSNIRVQTSRIEPTSEKDGYIITKIYCADCGKLISYKRVRIPKLS